MKGPLLETPDSTLPGISLSLNPSEAYEPSSTLQYVNSQLVAHGFVHAPGLSIEGISNEDGQKLVKCILAMLSQRMEDVNQTEQLGSKLRTLMYELERSQSFNKTARENAANAEREMTLHKNKLISFQRSHAAEIAAHKQTTSELQRARNALQYLRSTTQNELKRKEKEIERILERWGKVSDSQIKLGGASAGLQCANFAAACEQLMDKGIMEEALEQAEEARTELIKENEGFRSVLLGTANALQTVVYNIKSRDQDVHVPEPSPITPTAIFAPPTSCLAHPDNAHLKIKALFGDLKDTIANSQDLSSVNKAVSTDEEISKLRQTISSLRSELDVARRISNNNRTKAQEVFGQHVKYTSGDLKCQHPEHPAAEATSGRPDPITVTEQDAFHEELKKRTREMELERKKFTDATIKLGQHRSDLENERRHFLEEKRRWEADRMLMELPPAASVEDPDLIPSPKREFKDKPVSPKRQSTTKVVKSSKRSGVILKSPSKKKPKVTFKEDEAKTSQRIKMRRESKLFEKIEVLYEPGGRGGPSTSLEPIKPVVATTSIVPKSIPSVLESQVRRMLTEDSKPSKPLVLPTSFTLPPPSPASSLSLQPLIIPSPSSLGETLSLNAPISSTPIPLLSNPSSASASSDPLPSLLAPLSSSSAASSSVPGPSTSASTSSSFDSIPLAPSSSVTPSVLSRPIRPLPSPRTPRALLNVGLNGVKKHAYSPAKPSPLSRILMIADSPPSPRNGIGPIQEEEEIETAKPSIAGRAGLSIFESDTDKEASPLREKAETNFNARLAEVPARKNEKAKSKSRTMTMEKENVDVHLKGMKSATAEPRAKVRVKPSSNTTASKAMSLKATTAVKTDGPSQSQTVKPGGARRIPLGAPGAGKASGRLI